MADRQSAWNPNLLSTQPGGESSSEFDSSDSAYDSASDDEKPEAAAAPAAPAAIALPEAGPSSPRPRSLSPVTALNAPNKPAAVGSALKPALKPAPIGPTTFGGALKKSADGAAVQPRVVRRRQKMVNFKTSLMGRADGSHSGDAHILSAKMMMREARIRDLRTTSTTAGTRMTARADRMMSRRERTTRTRTRTRMTGKMTKRKSKRPKSARLGSNPGR